VSTDPHPPSPLEQVEHTIARTTHAVVHAAEELLRMPEPAASRWHRAGIGRRGERLFNVASALLLLTFAAGWSWSIASARNDTTGGVSGATPVTSAITDALTNPNAPTAAYLTDAALQALVPLRGESGRLRAAIRPAGAPVIGEPLPQGATLAVGMDSSAAAPTATRPPSATAPAAASSPAAAPAAPRRPGIWQLALRLGGTVQPVSNLNVITLTPFSAKRRGRIGLYYIGNWPTEGRAEPRPRYAPPSGFIEVTRANQHTQLSEHFQLRDFLPHDQQNVWPKYVVVDTRLLDKLELVLADLQARGIRTRGVRVMSGFRTPQYNSGGGDPRGRAGLSRHMYGDAADIFIDSDGNGNMDDLNRDGRVNIGDARVVEAAVDRVERAHPSLIGGVGVYPGTSAHGPFTHIDTRGYRARWVGTGDGG
jgi:uncharacterized protein YcbK (DUF882 family)